MAPSRSADAVGRVLGDRYRLTRPLGAGASAYVFVADDVVLRRRVAVKVLHPGLADDEGFLRRFRAEARVVAALRHPNILRVYDWGDDGGQPFLVMELLEGGSLRALLDRGHLLTPAQAASVGSDAARALDYAHRRGLVHRDIKPANLIFDDEGRLSVADFGLARALAEATWTEPAGAVVGTARYAAPEQARGHSLDDRADVYSLALVLIEAITGTVPFAADTTLATLMARVEQPLRAPESTGALRDVLDAAGAVDPADRPTASAFVEALHRAAARLPPPAPLPLAPQEYDGVIDLDADPTDYPGRPRLFDRDALRSASGDPFADRGLGDEGPDGWDPPAEVAGTYAKNPREAPVPGERRQSRGRRSAGRWVRRLIIALIALAVVAAGTVAVLAATRTFVPSHAVPPLVGDTPSRAQLALAPLHLHLAVVGHAYGNAPAGTVSSQDPANGTLKEGDSVSVMLSLGPRPVAVPHVATLTGAQAEAAISRAGLKETVSARMSSLTIPAGSVISAKPSAGTLLPGQAVAVVLSTGKPKVTVPSLQGTAGQSYATSQAALARAGLRASEAQEFSDTVPAGAVIGNNPPSGGTVTIGTTVTVYVSKGPQLFPVPDVQSDTVNQATGTLTADGFVVTGVSGNPTAAVTGTYPAAGSMLRRGSSVQIITG